MHTVTELEDLARGGVEPRLHVGEGDELGVGHAWRGEQAARDGGGAQHER